MLSANPAYKVAFSHDGINLYIPVEVTSYHKSREVAAMAQQIYSESGATPQVIKSIAEEALRICNTAQEKQVRTDVGTLMNNLLYRLKYPVDEDCAIRMGAILCFMEDEDPNKTEDFWTQKKIELAHKSPEAYAFFLTMGINNTPAYNNRLDISIDTDYFNNRREILRGLELPTHSVV